ncbi:MAG: translation elongation factor Ts [Candidatus Levybacteria bacterium]|nr:translation elongation factor Ts [Candidatus Levybacteria bacterium]
MSNVNIDQLKKLRNETSASIADCREAFEDSGGDYKKALEWIKKNALSIAEKKADRATEQGIIASYIHQNGRVGVLVELLCETDFVARTDEFAKLARELAMQVAAMNPPDVETLLKQEYIRDASQTVQDLIKGVIGKLGENITVKRFQRFAIGE